MKSILFKLANDLIVLEQLWEEDAEVPTLKKTTLNPLAELCFRGSHTF